MTARIGELQTQIAGLNAVVADLDLYARDPGRFGATTQALAVARDELCRSRGAVADFGNIARGNR